MKDLSKLTFDQVANMVYHDPFVPVFRNNGAGQLTGLDAVVAADHWKTLAREMVKAALTLRYAGVGEPFLKNMLAPFVKPDHEPRHFVCSHCGGTLVERDAFARWDADTQQYVIDTLFDDWQCADCGGECNVKEVPL